MSNSRLEQTGIKLLLSNNKSSNTYSRSLLPPSAKIDETKLEKIFNINCPAIAAGDFNTKSKNWNCNATNENGRRLEQYITNRNLEIAELTHYPNNCNSDPDSLNIAIIKDITHQYQIYAEKDLTFVHTPVFLKIDLKTKHSSEKNYNLQNMEIPGIVTIHQLEKAIINFKNHIITNFNNNTTCRKHRQTYSR